MGIRESDEKLETKVMMNRNLHSCFINILCLFGLDTQNKQIYGGFFSVFYVFVHFKSHNLKS